jgi:peptidoglycan/LPS O-acetylase OafA/YrhL
MYFQGLHGLRFIAAFLVVITHAESIRKKLGFYHFSDYSLFQTGGLAVQFFFVLSGFLITFLLLQEDEKNKTISLKSFYLRRVGRIFPLYYFLAIIGLFVLPFFLIKILKTPFFVEFDLYTGSVLYLFFLPNLANSWFNTQHLYPLWSIGVEEQFYLIWAPLMKIFKKYFIKICIFIVILKIGGLLFLNQNYPHEWFTKFFATLQFECMAIGGLGAWWIFYQEKKDITNVFLFKKPFQLLVFMLIASLIFFKIELTASENILGVLFRSIFNSLTYPIVSSVLFLYLILNISMNSKRLFGGENKILNYLGQISYGLYMYHILVVNIVIRLLGKTIFTWNPILSTSVFYVLTLGTLILVCHLSYQYFELPMMKRFKKA